MKPANPVLANATSCSACMLQDHTIRHIDFDSALDRGFTYGEGGKVQMDDLILCENCIKEASKLIGLVDEGSKDSKIREVEAAREAFKRERDSAQTYSDNLESAMDSRPQRIPVDHRKKPRASRAKTKDTE